MLKIRFFISMLATLFLCACSKPKPVPVYTLTYEVDVLSGNPFSVQYYSDLYYASGKEQTTFFNQPSAPWPYTVWWATRSEATGDSDYYIKIEFPDYNNPSNIEHSIRVYANDTTLLDELKMTAYSGPVILKGKVPELTFN